MDFIGISPKMVVDVTYYNEKGQEFSTKIMPKQFIFDQASPKGEKEWIFNALDIKAKRMRVIPMKDILEWNPVEV